MVHQRVDADAVQGIDFAHQHVRRHVLNSRPEDLALGLRNAVDLRHHGHVGQREHRPDLQRQVHAAGGFEHDQAQPAIHIGRAAQAKPGGLDQQNVAFGIFGPLQRVAQHHHMAMVGAELAGVDLPRRNAKLLGQQFILVGILHVELQERHAMSGRQQLAGHVPQHRGFAGGGGARAND